MALPPNESRSLSSYLDFDDDVDYGSDTSVHGDDGISSHSAVTEAHPHTASIPFVERDENIITNPLDEQQQLIRQREERALRRPHTQAVIRNRSGYVFSTPGVEQRLRQTEGRSLSTWATGPEATSPEDIAFRKALNERYLDPAFTTQGQYLAHLESLSRGVSVRPIKGVPILLFVGELPEEEDNEFIRWVYRKRHLSSVPTLRASADVADVRLERKLRFEYAKLKARG
ncbi:unnamed protein product [Hyaloperonospora brassicae]|uniref:Uncharacterized protein n=1 Tax=Hyaloperonospora brassicae TaxID=162125 RepID=A0AAV0T1P0_HYABA|nr:unnamed protein product [Hyaloperonospora brassicae]